MKKSAILRWLILEMVAASLVVSSPVIHRCRTDQFMDYLKNNDKKKIRICLSKNETYNSLCREELFLDIQGSKFPVEVLIKWRQLCSGQPEYNVTGTVTMGVESGLQDGRRQSVQDGRRQVMRLDGLTAGHLPPGRYIAMITVTERDDRQEGSARKSASLREEPRESSDAPGRFITTGRRRSEDTDSKRSQGITELYTSEFTKGLENACPVTNINMDTCFEQGFKNARLKFENMDPLHFNTTLKGGSRAVAWEVDGNVSVAGISNYTVKISKAESSDDPHQNRPLTITTAWVAPLWRIELGLTYHLTVIPDVIVIKMAARVAMALPDVEVLNSLDVWGQQQPDQGLVRFYTEDKNFRIKFDVDTAKIDVTIHKIPTLAHFDALHELVRLHFKHVALDTIWPNIEQKLGTVFKEVVNGGVVPDVIKFLLTRGAPSARQQTAPRKP